MAQKRGCLAIFFPRKGVNPETVALSSAAERLPLAFPYRPRKSMLSAAELVFYNVLKTAIGARFVILLKVGVSDLSVFAYPGQRDLMMVTFAQDYRTDNVSRRTLKRQFWAREGGRWRIVHEAAIS